MMEAGLPKKSHLGRSLIDKVAENLNVPHSRDLWAAAQIPFYSNFIDRTNRSLIEVAEFLQSHPKIRKSIGLIRIHMPTIIGKSQVIRLLVVL